MTENFKKNANKTLNDIFVLIEKHYKDFDVDFQDENLVVEIDDLTYVISIHNLTSQIWLSSPKSGAHHFTLNDSNVWTGTRNNEVNLFDLLKSEFDSLV
tara:strand:- start:287 stop:583 length:297 start_codon:yes stop_codon:yes gene_type:complete